MSGRLSKSAVVSVLLAFMGFAVPVGMPDQASAAQIVQTVTFSTLAAVSGEMNGVGSLYDEEAASANKFDPALGTLDSIGISISGSVASQASGGIEYAVPLCPANPPSLCPANAWLQFLGLSVQILLPDFSATMLFADRTDVCGTSICAQTLPALTADFADSATLTGSALLDYVGLDTVSILSLQNGILLYLNKTTYPFTGDFSGTLEAGGTVQIIYNYTPPSGPVAGVPEPATLAILGMGLAALGFMRRRRSA